MNADTNRLELPLFPPSFLSNQATGDSHALWCLEKARPMGNTGRRAVPKAILCLGLCAALYGVSVLAAAQGAAILYDQGPTRPLSDYVEARVPLSAASPSARPPLNC